MSKVYSVGIIIFVFVTVPFRVVLRGRYSLPWTGQNKKRYKGRGSYDGRYRL